MKRQVYAVFAFIGIVALASFATHGGGGRVPVIVDAKDKNAPIEISHYGVANALLAARGDGVDNPFGGIPSENQNTFLGEGKADPTDDPENPLEEIPYADPEPSTDPTICNLFVQAPEIGSVVSNSFSVSGYVDSVPNPECYWTVFEANAGGVEVYDNFGNLLSQYHILTSVGSWMQSPSYFQSIVQLVSMPETQYGYIRFYEHEVSDNPAVIFDYPITFSNYGVTVAPPDGNANGLFSAISDFFRSAEERERRRQAAEEAAKPTGDSDFFDRTEDVGGTGSESPVVDRPRVEISPVGDDYCEVRQSTKLICYGSYISEDSDICGCDTFPTLQSFRQKESAVNFTVDTREVLFSKTLFIGDRGENVRNLQELLYRLGYYKQIPSGIYDGVTVKAVREFQYDNALSGWGLIVGQKSRDALKSLFSQEY